MFVCRAQFVGLPIISSRRRQNLSVNTNPPQEEHSHPLLSELMARTILALRAATGWAKALESLRRTHASGGKIYDAQGYPTQVDLCRFRFLGRDYDYTSGVPGMTAVDPIHAWLLPLQHWLVKYDMLGIAQVMKLRHLGVVPQPPLHIHLPRTCLTSTQLHPTSTQVTDNPFRRWDRAARSRKLGPHE